MLDSDSDTAQTVSTCELSLEARNSTQFLLLRVGLFLVLFFFSSEK